MDSQLVKDLDTQLSGGGATPTSPPIITNASIPLVRRAVFDLASTVPFNTRVPRISAVKPQLGTALNRTLWIEKPSVVIGAYATFQSMQNPLDAHVLFPARIDKSQPKPQCSLYPISIADWAVMSSEFCQQLGCKEPSIYRTCGRIVD
jgi:hypothetical protein